MGDLSNFFFAKGYHFHLTVFIYTWLDYGFFPKKTPRYAFALVEASRRMPVDMPEKLNHIINLDSMYN